MNTTRTLLKFHGKFTDLIPAGWKFQKLFANNYRQYHIEPAGEYFNTIRVWQHHGGYVEIDDYFSNSEAVIRHAVTYTKKEGSKFFDNMPVLNKKTGQIEMYNREKHCDMWVYFDSEKKGESEEVCSQRVKQLFDTYRKCALEDKTIEYLKKMVELGWIKV